MLRQLDVDRRVQVAVLVGLARDRHTVSLQPEYLRVLCRRRNLESERLTAKRLHFGFAAEHGGRQRDRHARVKVATFALEVRMRALPNSQIQVAGLRAASPLFAFPGDTDARPITDA